MNELSWQQHQTSGKATHARTHACIPVTDIQLQRCDPTLIFFFSFGHIFESHLGRKAGGTNEAGILRNKDPVWVQLRYYVALCHLVRGRSGLYLVNVVLWMIILMQPMADKRFWKFCFSCRPSMHYCSFFCKVTCMSLFCD